MKIQLYSDLHIEFEEFEATVDKADVIIFAGDVGVGEMGINWLKRLKTDKPLLYVLGNHEYYRNIYPTLTDKLLSLAKDSNIHILENRNIVIEGVCFHGCTLWTDFEIYGNPRADGYKCQGLMTDFRLIRVLPNYSTLKSHDVALIHRRSLSWLSESLAKSISKQNVVITHHAPSIKSVPGYYKNNTVSAAYASNLESFILKHTPDLWVHGHLHNSSDYQIDTCRVICNPRGYSGEFNPEFESEKIIEL